MKKEKVDYSVSSSFGGDIEDIPLPHQRMFPGRKKRIVRVSIVRYVGAGVHYYANLREEPNPIWCAHRDTFSSQPHWHQAWDDNAANGREFSGRFNTHEGAEEFVRQTVTKEFPVKTHKILADHAAEKAPKWFYREGD